MAMLESTIRSGPAQQPGPTSWLRALLASGQATDQAALLSLIMTAEQLLAWVSSVQLEAIAGFVRLCRADAEAWRASSGKAPPLSAEEVAESELALALTLTAIQAGARLQLAATLQQLPMTRKLLGAGRIDAYRAGVIAEELSHSSLIPGSEAWVAVEAKICARAPEWTSSQIRRGLRRALLAAAPGESERRRKRAVRERQVVAYALPDGMGAIDARLTAEGMVIVDRALSALADAGRAEESSDGTFRTHQQRRADALLSVFTAILDGQPLPFVPVGGNTPTPPPGTSSQNPSSRNASSRDTTFPDDVALAGADGNRPVVAWWKPPKLPGQHGRRPHVTLTVAQETLAGRDEMPGELGGYGSVSAQHAREIVAAMADRNPTVDVLVRYPGAPGRAGRSALHGDAQVHTATPAAQPGHGSHHGEACSRGTYRAQRTVVREVQARYPRCSAPGCPRSAIRCDLDHVVPFGSGGRTCVHNLRPLCRRHHRLKTHAGWQVEHSTDPDHPPGTTIWRTRYGTTRCSKPPPLPGDEDC
jgi:hypothetical protein